MRNNLNVQIYSFKQPNFLIISANAQRSRISRCTDQGDVGQIRELAKLAAGPAASHKYPIHCPSKRAAHPIRKITKGPRRRAFSALAANSIPALQRRGAVLLSRVTTRFGN
jgi:hypothetical protein